MVGRSPELPAWKLRFPLLWGPKLHVNDKLHILQKKAVRIIICNSYFAHSEPLFKQLRLLKTCDIYKCQLLKCIFKLIHKQLGPTTLFQTIHIYI